MSTKRKLIVVGVIAIVIFMLKDSIQRAFRADAIGYKFCYYINELGHSEPVLVVFNETDTDELVNWYEMKMRGEKPVSEDGLGEFEGIPSGLRAEVLKYSKDSSVAKIRIKYDRLGRLSDEIEVFASVRTLHEMPIPNKTDE